MGLGKSYTNIMIALSLINSVSQNILANHCYKVPALSSNGIPTDFQSDLHIYGYRFITVSVEYITSII